MSLHSLIRHPARAAARRLGLGLAAGAMLLAGLCLVTHAAWAALAAAQGPAVASGAVGMFWMAAGLATLWRASARARAKPTGPGGDTLAPALIAAFVQGIALAMPPAPRRPDRR